MLFLTMQAFAAARQIPDPATRLNVASMVLSSGGPGFEPGCLTVLPCASGGSERCLATDSCRVISHCPPTETVAPPQFDCSAGNCDPAVSGRR
jgi:hypothetical protein